MNHLVKYLTLLMGILSASHIAAFGFTSSPSPATVTATATHRSLLSASSARSIGAFTAVNRAHATKASIRSKSALKAEEEGASAAAADPNDLIARRLFVVGDVSGGYYRSCVKNEASRFRKLVGIMSPPDKDDEKRAEIYVEGKRKMVEGFVRWCQRGDVGLSQKITVDSVADEFPCGLYDDFTVDTGR